MNDNTAATIESLLKRVEHLEQNGIPGVRDFFATSALSILGSDIETGTPAMVAKFAYEIADAMVKERAEKNASPQ